MKRIGYITWGNASQVRSFHDFAHLLDDMLYLRELERHDLSRYAALIVPDVMDCATLRRYARQLNDYVRGGGFLVVFSVDGIAELIDVVDLKWHPVNTRTGSGGPGLTPIWRSTSPNRSTRSVRPFRFAT